MNITAKSGTNHFTLQWDYFWLSWIADDRIFFHIQINKKKFHTSVKTHQFILVELTDCGDCFGLNDP